MDVLQAVAGGAHLLVHLVAAADGGMVERVQVTIVGPGVLGGLQAVLGLIGRCDRGGCEQTSDQACGCCTVAGGGLGALGQLCCGERSGEGLGAKGRQDLR